MDGEIKKTLLAALGRAIEGERYGQHFYRMAAGSTEDEKGRSTFEAMAQEEKLHEEFLIAQARAIEETGESDSSFSLGDPGALDGPSPIFSDRVKGRARNAHGEMMALGIGVQIELSSVNFYKELAEGAPDPEIRTFFEKLVSWESTHYDALLRQQQSLREEYLQDAGFVPF